MKAPVTTKHEQYVNVGTITGQLTCEAVLVVSPANARSAATNWGLVANKWMDQCGKRFNGMRPMDSGRRSKWASSAAAASRLGSLASGVGQRQE